MVGPFYVCGCDMASGAVGPFATILEAAEHYEFQRIHNHAAVCYHNNTIIIPEHMLRTPSEIRDDYGDFITSPEKDRESTLNFRTVTA